MSLTSLLRGTQNITGDEFHVTYLSLAESSCIVNIILGAGQESIISICRSHSIKHLMMLVMLPAHMAVA